MLHSPIYAGIHTYGRRRVDPRRKIPGRPGSGKTVTAEDQWLVMIPGPGKAPVRPTPPLDPPRRPRRARRSSRTPRTITRLVHPPLLAKRPGRTAGRRLTSMCAVWLTHLHRPADTDDAHQVVNAGNEGCVAEVVGDLLRFAHAAPGQRPPLMHQLLALVSNSATAGSRTEAQSYSRSPLAPCPQERRSHACSGAWAKRWSMRGQPTVNWDFGTAST